MDYTAKLRAVRAEAGFTQADAAEKMGICLQTLSDIEQGKFDIGVMTYRDLAGRLKMEANNG
jgi:DNA-binding XRE family transcriptional regulator